MTVSKDTIRAVMLRAMQVCHQRGDVSGLFEAMTGAIITAAALRPEGVGVMRGCAEVLVAAAAELERRRAQDTAEVSATIAAIAGNSAGNSGPGGDLSGA